MGNVDNGGDYARVGQEVYGKFLYLSLNFAISLNFAEPKTALKIILIHFFKSKRSVIGVK